MLMLLVPILISYLLEGQALRSPNKYSISLHDVSLQWLMKIGPKYPQVFMDYLSFSPLLFINYHHQEFKKMMSQSVDLKVRLENAIRHNQQVSQKNKPETNSNKPSLSQTPSIKLKTDFSNFS